MSAPQIPDDRKYHAEHDWALVDGDVATFGITWFAQDALGEIVWCELPPPGTLVVAGTPYAELESVKAVSDVVAPLSGEVVELNATLAASPARINEDPYGAGWLVRVRLVNPAELTGLLDAEAYEQLIA